MDRYKTTSRVCVSITNYRLLVLLQSLHLLSAIDLWVRKTSGANSEANS